MARPIQKPPPALSPQEAEQLILRLSAVMDELLAVVAQETALVRLGRLSEAATLEPRKGELAGEYLAAAAKIKINAAFLKRIMPRVAEALQSRHDDFHALLQVNLTVLATAHAVSESIIRGVADELTRKAAPQGYGAGGRAPTAYGKNAEPMALSRVL